MAHLDDLALVQRNVAVGQLTTYKLGGPASHYAEVSDSEGLAAVLDAWRGSGVPLLVLGRGSNLVVADDGIDALVLRLAGQFNEVVQEASAVLAGAAVRLPQLARAAVAVGRLGLEFYAGIPGSVGGAVRQNAGGHGRETKDVLIEVRLLDARTGTVETVPASDLELSYRHSSIEAHQVVLDARFSFEPGNPAEGEARIRDITRWRREHQPGGTHNAGSVFKNPPGDSAGRIIDELGLKGFTVGDVAVSELHANFFVAGKDATASDLYRLVNEVQRAVAERAGVELEIEIQFEGFV